MGLMPRARLPSARPLRTLPTSGRYHTSGLIVVVVMLLLSMHSKQQAGLLQKHRHKPHA